MIGRLRALLSSTFEARGAGADSAVGELPRDEGETDLVERRLDAARRRLKQTIPPREE